MKNAPCPEGQSAEGHMVDKSFQPLKAPRINLVKDNPSHAATRAGRSRESSKAKISELRAYFQLLDLARSRSLR